MSGKKGGFMEILFSTIMPKVYGIGAAVVIVGALFKILHWPGAAEMLTVGLLTEAGIFLLSAFEPKHPEIDWTKVYPQLSEEYDGDDLYVDKTKKPAKQIGDSTSQKLDKMLDEKIGPELIESLSKGLQNMAESAKNMSTLSDAAVATNEYAGNVKEAGKALSEMNKAYNTTVGAMQEMSSAAKDTKEYHSIVQNVTKNLTALNSVYEMELQDSNNHLKAMNKFYSNLTVAMDNMAEASKSTDTFRSQLSKLTDNLSSLNNIYGSMLSAMRGTMSADTNKQS